MLVYRVENNQGIGPYKVYPKPNSIMELCEAHNSSRAHPAPGADPGLGVFMQKDYFCGFASEAVLKKWFHGWRKHLRTAGFHMAVYQARKVLVSKYTGQVIFKKGLAKKTKTLPVP